MAKILTAAEAVSTYIQDGSTVTFGGFANGLMHPEEIMTALESAALQGEALILRGQLIQGAPGELEATEVAVAQLTLTREQGGGWQLASLTLS